MSVDIADVLKYGWLALCAFIPKLFSSVNSRFKTLETMDAQLREHLETFNRKQAVVETKLDTLTDKTQELRVHMDNIYTILTDLRVQQGKLQERE